MGTVLRPAHALGGGREHEDRLQISADHPAVTVPATGEPATLTVRVMNTSTIVDGYGVGRPGRPPG